jgi:hypothetical protein
VPRPHRIEARTKAELAQFDARIKQLNRHFYTALAALEPSRRIERTADKWLFHIRRANTAFAEVLDASREGFETKAGARLDAENEAANRLARELGAHDCIAPRSGTTYGNG